MTKEQAIKRKAELDAELKQVEEIIQQPEISKEERFWGLINGLQLKFDFNKYPNTIFLFDGENCIVEYNTKSNYLWLRYSMWSVFETEYRLKYQEILLFIKKEVEEHFRCTGITPDFIFGYGEHAVEEHFRYTGITPFINYLDVVRKVEEHFKMKEVAPGAQTSI